MQPLTAAHSRRGSTIVDRPHTIPITYSDQRTHGYQGPSRAVSIPRASSVGGGSIAKSEDGTRCAVAGVRCEFLCTTFTGSSLKRDLALRILRISDPSAAGIGATQEHKSATGRGGHRIDASRNIWDGSGLKMESATTGVVWAHGRTCNHAAVHDSKY